MSEFKDHFSANAADYARFRPRYPVELFAYLASLATEHSLAWDCATGNGQAAVALAEHFAHVIATDASDGQITYAESRPGVEYRVAAAENSGLADASAELVTVAQALHWFDAPAFFREVSRVLRPGGVVAVWCYGRLEMESASLRRCVDRFYSETVGPYWPPERYLVEEGYRSLDFPFTEITPPAFAMQADMALDALIGYLGTWSATQRYQQKQGRDPLPELRRELESDWGDPQTTKTIRWPLSLRVGRST